MAEIFEYGGYGVNVKLTNANYSPDVAWVRGNSFVLVANPKGRFLHGSQRVDLVSINGIGEIRWPVPDRDIWHAEDLEAKGMRDDSWDCFMHLSAARHFGLSLAL